MAVPHCSACGGGIHPSLPPSAGFMSQSGPSLVPALAFSLIITPEEFFQLVGSCCFQSPGEDGDVVLMPS